MRSVPKRHKELARVAGERGARLHSPSVRMSRPHIPIPPTFSMGKTGEDDGMIFVMAVEGADLSTTLPRKLRANDSNMSSKLLPT
jgi:hypothetical protein